MSAEPDYRQSHCQPGKGESYHAAFSKNPYRRMVWEMEQEILVRILEDHLAGRRLLHLDFACGTGRILRFMAGRAAESTGVDVSPAKLAVARRENPAAEIVEADLTRNDVLGTRLFDLITAFRFFPNAQPELRRDVIAVLRRHLSPQGILVFNNHRNPAALRPRLAKWIGRRGNPGMGMDEAGKLVAEAGLDIRAVHPLCVFPVAERYPVLPVSWLRRIEDWARRHPRLGPFGENQILVCGRPPGTGGSTDKTP